MLLRSGIGPKAEVENAKAASVVDSSSVGKNLTDHLVRDASTSFIPHFHSFSVLGISRTHALLDPSRSCSSFVKSKSQA